MENINDQQTIYKTEPSVVQKTTEHAHTKILQGINEWMTQCKEKKQDCQCSFTLTYNEAESDEHKRWQFLYQCSDNKDATTQMKFITLSFLGIMPNAPTVEQYK